MAWYPHGVTISVCTSLCGSVFPWKQVSFPGKGLCSQNPIMHAQHPCWNSHWRGISRPHSGGSDSIVWQTLGTAIQLFTALAWLHFASVIITVQVFPFCAMLKLGLIRCCPVCCVLPRCAVLRCALLPQIGKMDRLVTEQHNSLQSRTSSGARLAAADDPST